MANEDHFCAYGCLTCLERKQSRVRGTEVTDYEMLVQRIRVGHPEDTAAEMIRLLDKVVKETRRDQARLDAELMQVNSDRSPKTTPPKGGTNGRTVFASAAEMLHPDKLGWSLNLPDHLRFRVPTSEHELEAGQRREPGPAAR